MKNTLIAVRWEMTPSVNELYVEVKEGTKHKPNGGRILQKKWANLKTDLVNGLFNGFYMKGGLDFLYYRNQKRILALREEYDIARLRRKPFPLHRYALKLTLVFRTNKSDGDNRVKFIQDVLSKFIGFNDAQVKSVYTEQITDNTEEPYVIAVLYLIDEEFEKTTILQEALDNIEQEEGYVAYTLES
jgi:Holliday junction resolvase RusA-like endonuclease